MSSSPDATAAVPTPVFVQPASDGHAVLSKLIFAIG
jgi:hypothetical protein